MLFPRAWAFLKTRELWEHVSCSVTSPNDSSLVMWWVMVQFLQHHRVACGKIDAGVHGVTEALGWVWTGMGQDYVDARQIRGALRNWRWEQNKFPPSSLIVGPFINSVPTICPSFSSDILSALARPGLPNSDCSHNAVTQCFLWLTEPHSYTLHGQGWCWWVLKATQCLCRQGETGRTGGTGTFWLIFIMCYVWLPSAVHRGSRLAGG